MHGVEACGGCSRLYQRPLVHQLRLPPKLPQHMAVRCSSCSCCCSLQLLPSPCSALCNTARHRWPNRQRGGCYSQATILMRAPTTTKRRRLLCLKPSFASELNRVKQLVSRPECSRDVSSDASMSVLARVIVQKICSVSHHLSVIVACIIPIFLCKHAGSGQQLISISNSARAVANRSQQAPCIRDTMEMPISTRVCKMPAWMPKAWILGQIAEADEEDPYSEVSKMMFWHGAPMHDARTSSKHFLSIIPQMLPVHAVHPGSIPRLSSIG